MAQARRPSLAAAQGHERLSGRGHEQLRLLALEPVGRHLDGRRGRRQLGLAVDRLQRGDRARSVVLTIAVGRHPPRGSTAFTHGGATSTCSTRVPGGSSSDAV